MIDSFFPIYALVFVFSFTVTVLMEKILIPAFKKRAQQPIYADGPKWHQKKSGTPTLGGLGFLTAILFSLAVAMPLLIKAEGMDSFLRVILCIFYAALNGCVGIIDDLKKLRRKENQGLTPTQKLILQFALAILFLYLRKLILNGSTAVSFAFGELELGFWYYPITALILVGIINFANLTDGIDGLATSVAFSISICLLYISAALCREIAILSSAIIGATVGFLIFNLHPAKIFMGDTGSLFFGAIVACASVMLDNPLIAIVIGGIYVIEGVSVILQVLYFKLTGRRIFKMAPLHHHLEQCGWSENKICIVAILLTFIFSIPAYIFYLP